MLSTHSPGGRPARISKVLAFCISGISLPLARNAQQQADDLSKYRIFANVAISQSGFFTQSLSAGRLELEHLNGVHRTGVSDFPEHFAGEVEVVM